MENLKPAYDFNSEKTETLIRKCQFEVEINGNISLGTCDIYLELLPRPKVSLYSMFTDLSNEDYISLFNGDAQIASPIICSNQVECLLFHVSPALESSKSKQRWGLKRSFAVGVGNEATEINHLIFHLFNFVPFTGTRTSVDDESGSVLYHIDLSYQDWVIELQSLPNTRENFDKINNVDGGTYLTHVGRIRRESGECFTGREAHDLLEALRYFLSFAKGEPCEPVFSVGFNSMQERVWETWSAPDNSSGKASSWFEVHNSSQLETLFPLYMQKWKSQDWEQTFRQVIYWYLNSKDPFRGTSADLILIQAGLEKLSYEYIVKEMQFVTRDRFDRKNSHWKIRKLLTLLEIPIELFDYTPNLKRFAHLESMLWNWDDSPAAIVEIRHSLVHPERETAQQLIPTHREAIRLGLWYLELSLLGICGYNGTYSNRLDVNKTAHGVETVPWSIPSEE